MSATAAEKQTFLNHLKDLRQRLLWVGLYLALGSTVGFIFYRPIVQILQRPLHKPLYYFSPIGAVHFIFQIALLYGAIISLPALIYNLVRFIEPAMPKLAKPKLFGIVFASIGLALVGIAFAYAISLPAALHFFGSFDNQAIQALISADEYFRFVLIYLASFALLFQLPLIILLINRIKPLKPKRLMHYQRIVIAGSFLVSAVLTPTFDVVNQIIYAIPMIALYEVSIGLVWLVNRRVQDKTSKHHQPIAQPLTSSVSSPMQTVTQTTASSSVRPHMTATEMDQQESWGMTSTEATSANSHWVLDLSHCKLLPTKPSRPPKPSPGLRYKALDILPPRHYHKNV